MHRATIGLPRAGAAAGQRGADIGCTTNENQSVIDEWRLLKGYRSYIQRTNGHGSTRKTRNIHRLFLCFRGKFLDKHEKLPQCVRTRRCEGGKVRRCARAKSWKNGTMCNGKKVRNWEGVKVGTVKPSTRSPYNLKCQHQSSKPHSVYIIY